MKSCKSHEKKWNKKHQTLSFPFFTNRFSFLMFFVSFSHVVCKISYFNMWTTKHLAQSFCTELILKNCPQFRCQLCFTTSNNWKLIWSKFGDCFWCQIDRHLSCSPDVTTHFETTDLFIKWFHEFEFWIIFITFSKGCNVYFLVQINCLLSILISIV